MQTHTIEFEIYLHSSKTHTHTDHTVSKVRKCQLPGTLYLSLLKGQPYNDRVFDSYYTVTSPSSKRHSPLQLSEFLRTQMMTKKGKSITQIILLIRLQRIMYDEVASLTLKTHRLKLRKRNLPT
jgi:hypothetical protein